jgi:hypothetical protein
MLRGSSYKVFSCGLEGDEGEQWDYHQVQTLCKGHAYWEGHSPERVQEDTSFGDSLPVNCSDCCKILSSLAIVLFSGSKARSGKCNEC